MKVTLESGFSCELDPEVRDDIELLELLIELDGGDRSALPAAVEKTIGAEGKKALYDHLRSEKGRVSTNAVHKALIELFKASKDTKN